MQTRTRGAALRRSVTARRIALLATTCPRCGKVEVLWRGKRLGKRISLTTPKTRHRRVIKVGRLRGVRTGRVTIRVLTQGKPVRIDGLAPRLR